MKYITEFLPENGPPQLKRIWKAYAIFFVIFSIPPWVVTRDLIFNLAGEVFVLIVFVPVILFFKNDVSIIISQLDKTITFNTIGNFGKMHQVTISIPEAKLSYKYKPVFRNKTGWNLLIYTNYFFKRISVNEDKQTGFSAEQLEKIFEMVKEIKDGSGNTAIKSL